MKHRAFKMKLKPGYAAEYQRRHDALWPELATLLREHGISDYSIFLDEETLTLFGVLKFDESISRTALPQHPVMRRWWAYMADLMETNPDQSPVEAELKQVFYLA
ncbi:MAG: L-rhamnose mutarotase [Verrucomicrobia bacterium]|nr:MAG: L-rhamnose mutarotase [Verrucomicrobiota bacterium]